jgi:hypothetical protein
MVAEYAGLSLKEYGQGHTSYHERVSDIPARLVVMVAMSEDKETIKMN